MGRPRGITTARIAAGVGRRRQGVCPVCRSRRSLRDTDGKMMPHGKTAASPRGCAGIGQAPVRDASGTLSAGVRPLVDAPPGPHDGGPEPHLDLAVRVERRDDAPVRVRPDGPGAA